jgi:putative ABC transport system permease protein
MWQTAVTTGDQDPSDASTDRMVAVEHGGPEYFRTFGIPLVRGRAFTEADHRGAPSVAIVSETLARSLWPQEDPIGKGIRAPGPGPNPNGLRTVVGIAGDTHLRILRESTPTVYVPSLQGYWQGSVAIRSSTDLGRLVPALNAAADQVDPQLDLWAPRTMNELLAEPLAQPRLSALLMSSAGLVALLLAAIGLFGVMVSLVHDQTREFGIRIALGATPGRVRRQVLAQASVVVGTGLIVGLVAALISSRLMASLLFQISPTDPAALLGASVLLFAVAGVAAYLPARRATAIDPAEALRGP